ncbi:sigma-70 family RNA polymerase sigma factor [Photobacterium sp. BZF1]|uniref:sigma-70 family RNA polymerase sigma factor n=1 Tax=Photobacterium sp. BZF1 TaxID=1904457 RepID=UPI00165363BE|nr:sigma-70 family RNA polymerase sigma factor [Photobacterium sp. BZF1]MBC7001622.1 sigma-70 family RNA polymerase sigma factor [Photobacterium sp. BZF1]
MLMQRKYQHTPSSHNSNLKQIEKQALQDNIKMIHGLLYRYRYAVDDGTYEDLRQTAMMTLIIELRKFDHVANEDFRRAVAVRIRGELIDELRRRDYMERDKRQMVNKIKHTERELLQILGREPNSGEICRHLGIDSQVYQQAMLFVDVVDDIELDNIVTAVPETDKQVLFDEVKQVLETLPELEKRIIYLVYVKSLTTKEVALVLGTNEVKIHRLKHRGLEILKSRIQESDVCKR